MHRRRNASGRNLGPSLHVATLERRRQPGFLFTRLLAMRQRRLWKILRAAGLREVTLPAGFGNRDAGSSPRKRSENYFSGNPTYQDWILAVV
jgi:hypothetical protein